MIRIAVVDDETYIAKFIANKIANLMGRLNVKTEIAVYTDVQFF